MHAQPKVSTSSISSAPRRQATAMHKAIDIIHEEHYSLRVVLLRMKIIVFETLTTQVPCDCMQLKLMLEYIRTFPEALHHPKEDSYLFAKLRQRTSEFDDIILQLSRSHDSGDHWLNELEAALTRFESGFPPAFDIFSRVFGEYYEVQQQHMHLEETVIIPAAIAHLSTEDWEEIAEAFGSNGDPRFSAPSQNTCLKLYSKISRLATPLDCESAAMV